MDEFCRQKGIKREYSVARTPQQNRVAERKNRTLIEAARTMLADSLLPIVFWAEAVNTACYVLNRVLVTKPHNKTPYELPPYIGRAPSISFMRPFGCPVTILNTLDPLGKFDGKAEEGFLVGYSVNSKAFRVFNSQTRKVEENLHVNFLENKPNVAGQGPNWLFDIDSLTNSMNYQPVTAGNQTNKNAGPQEANGNTGLKQSVDAGQSKEKNMSTQQYIVFPLWSSISSNNSKDKTGLGYGDQLNKNDSSGSELFNSVFDSHSSDGDDNQTNDRFKKDNGYHADPPPLIGNYIPPLADLSFAGLNDSIYRPIANKTSGSVSQVETRITPPSNTSVEMPRVKFVRPSGVIIEDWVSDDDEDIFQSNDLQATDKPSFKKIEFTNARNESIKPKQAEKPRITTQNPKVDRRDWNGKMTQKLGLGFGSTKKASFVCGSYSNLIKDCDFHEKRMAKKSVLKNMGKNTGQREIRPLVLLSEMGSLLAGCVWRPKMTDLNNGSKDNSGSWISKRGNPQQALKYKGMFDNGCSRHITGNKALLTDYQDIDGGFIAFGGSTRGGANLDRKSTTGGC
ncbi:retrovirus-related pol polyprotein from transposon TNT 1-94 [Tanacetum coccineum]